MRTVASLGPISSAGVARGWLAIVLLLAACQSNPTGTYRGSLQRAETDNSRNDTTSQLIEVGVQDRLGPDLQYRVSDRLLLSESELESDGTTSSEERLLHHPSFDLSLGLGALTWISGLETQQQSTTPSAGPSNRLIRDTILQKLVWQPEGLPRIETWVEWDSRRDDVFIDESNVEGTLLVQKTDGPVTYELSLQGEHEQDERTGVERDRLESIVRGTYRDSHLDGDLEMRVGVFLNDRDQTSRFPSGVTIGLPPDEVVPTEGLAEIDPTPELGTLATNGALIDGDEDTPAGVNIGGFASGGQPDWNIGLRSALPKTVDLIVLTTEQEVIPFLWPEFRFSVWISDDGQFWDLVTSNAVFSYETAFRRFRILLPPATGRYFKVVAEATPPNADAIEVTEIRAFEPSTTVPGEPAREERADRTRNVSANLTWNATPTVRVGYDLFAQVTDRTADGASTSDETRLDNGLDVSWSATERVEASLRGQMQVSNDPRQLDQTFLLVSGLIDYRMLETLDLAWTYTFTERTEEGEDSFRTSAAQMRTSAQLLPALQADLTIERSRQDDLRNERIIDRTILGAQAVADLTRTVDLTLSARSEMADVTGAGAAGIPDPDEDIYEILAAYRPNPQLTTEVRLEWRDTFAGSGLDRRLRVDWIPFQDGALDLQIDVQRIDNGLLEQRRDQYLLLSRWTLARDAFLELNWALQEPENEPSAESVSLALNLSF